MKKVILSWLLLCFASISCFAQNPSQADKLFYTCKVYGFVKYYHSEVSTCKINWDSVLLDRLPAVKAAITKNEFNDVLKDMLAAAGPMAPATIPLPDTLPAELKRNRDWSWTNDTWLRSDISAVLNNIKANFIPHDICWVADNDYANPANGGWLLFAADTNYLEDISVRYPTEEKRIVMYFKYWNILNYFNPYKYVLDQPWDESFHDIIPLILSASNEREFKLAFVKLNKELNDAHVEISNPNFSSVEQSYSPKNLSMRYASGKYIATQQFRSISRGDEITHFNGLSVAQWEDSLRSYISAGNETVFRRFVKSYMTAGSLGENCTITFKDSNGVNRSHKNIYRTEELTTYNTFFANDSLKKAKIGFFPCGIAYFNPANISLDDLEDYYYQVSSSPTLIIDTRGYLPWDVLKKLCTLMFAKETTFSYLTLPNVKYPGTYDRWYGTAGIDNPSPYNGNVILLTYENTQSQGEFSVMHLQQLPNVITVGTTTSGTDGNITFLPNIIKGSRFIFTTLGVYYPNGDSTQRIGVGPRKPGDVLVELTQDGIRHNRDEILEAALKAAGCPLSTEEIKNVMNGTTLYPNPATNTFSITTNSKDAIVKIYSLTGQLMLQTTQVSNINIQHLPTGVYVVQVTADGQTQTEKLIKE